MIDDSGHASVLEFNCRLGDPETQPIMMRLQSDLTAVCEAAIAGTLADVALDWDPRAALGVVLAAEGYPGDYRKGDVITGLDGEQNDSKVFHAGTRASDGDTVTSGGRVLCATALGTDVAQAAERAYALARRIQWRGRFMRSDIGHRAIARES